MKTLTMTMKLIATVAIAIGAPQTSYTQHTRPQDVNVVNTPNVNVLQGGAWSVGIDPSSNTVLVASSARDPVLTTQTLQLVNIFQRPMEIVLAQGQVLGYASFTVPAGKLLVIEEVSGLAHMGLNPQFPTVSFRTTANNCLAEHVCVTPFPNGPLQYPVFMFGNTAYADPGSTVELIYMRDGEGGVSTLNVTFSGHYINQ
jgi:hypothetical protein